MSKNNKYIKGVDEKFIDWFRLSYKRFRDWLDTPNPSTLATWLKIKAEEKKRLTEEKYQKTIEREAYLLWEADGKPESKADYYWKKAKDKLLLNRPLRRFALWWETTITEKWLEDLAFLLKNSALLDIINLLAGITIIISLGTWWIGRTERLADEKISAFLTWTKINESGKHPEISKLALERLLEKKLSLMRVKLTNLILEEVNLQGADLYEATLKKAYLVQANLQEAVLFKANLQEAVLFKANLQGAVLFKANLQEADLGEANLQEAILIESVNLTDSQIKSACFWQKAIYEGSWDAIQWKWIAEEPANTEYIKKLEQDESSDPIVKPNCSKWE